MMKNFCINCGHEQLKHEEKRCGWDTCHCKGYISEKGILEDWKNKIYKRIKWSTCFWLVDYIEDILDAQAKKSFEEGKEWQKNQSNIKDSSPLDPQP